MELKSRNWICHSNILPYVILFMIASINCQTTSEVSTEKNTDTFTSSDFSTNTTSPPFVSTTKICRECVCNDTSVDCSDLDLMDFFTAEDWAGLQEMAPLTVDLSENSLSEVLGIYELPIRVLNLSHNEIVTIERASFKYLQNMTVLDLSYNKLTAANLNPHVFEGHYAPEEYEPLEAMRVLNLAYNDLHSLNQDLFEHLPKLEELSLAGNPLQMIDHVTVISISGLQLLKVLNLKGCQLEEIPDKFLHTPRYLENLDLSDNHLDSVPEELEEARSLKYLNLNNNPIRYIDQNNDDFDGFPLLPNLIELHLCNMPKLEEIHDLSMGGLTALTHLHMSNNTALSFISPKALARHDTDGEGFDWPPLKEIYIQNNNLSEIDSRLVSRWDKLERIEVGFNPFLCDCSTQWMADTLVTLVDNIRPNASSNLICREPVEMRGKTLKYVHDNNRHMRCVDKYGNRPERDGALLLGSLIGVLLSVPICLIVVLLYKKGYFATCGVRGPADFSRAFYKRTQTDDFNF